MIRVVLLLLAVLGFAAFVARDYAARHPEDLPWTPLDLAAPVGRATAAKLAALARDPARCRALLAAAGVAAVPLPDREIAPGCRITGAVRVSDLGLALDPGDLTMSCPMAAATLVWSRQVVRPAARAHLGTNATALTNFGSTSCRRIAGSSRLSEHATANALDVARVRTARAGTVGVARDWGRPGPRGDFLRAVHDGGCRVFGAVLGPDYNAAHRDHFHLDLGPWRACR